MAHPSWIAIGPCPRGARHVAKALICSFALSAALGVPVYAQAASTLIYDNSDSSFTGAFSVTSLWLGDEVRLPPGESRIINLLEVGVNSQGIPATTDIQARLYSNDGIGGAPGTLLWESDLQVDVSLSGGNDLIGFDVPNITVPDIFTWVVQTSDSSPVEAGLPIFGSPSIGMSPDFGWFGSGTPGSLWAMLDATSNPQGVPVQFLARVHAVAVPAPLPLFGVSAAFACSRRLRRRRAHRRLESGEIQ